MDFCHGSSWDDLAPLVGQSRAALVQQLWNCPEQCRFVYGTGNPDVTGIGVVSSYGMSLGFAALFGPILQLDCYILPSYISRYRPTPLGQWFLRHQHTCIWSQLLFALTLCLSCFVRTYEGSAIYEGAIMAKVVIIALVSVVLTTSAIFNRMGRMVVFLVCLFLTFVFAVFTALAPIIIGYKNNAVLLACAEVARKQNLSWAKGAVMPYSPTLVFPRLFTYIGLVMLSVGTWFFLWFRRNIWLVDPGQKPALRYRLLLTLNFMSSIVMMYFACETLDRILQRRMSLASAWDGDSDEDFWGVGQVGATLTWAPLVVDMFSSVAVAAKDRVFHLFRRRPRSVDAEIQLDSMPIVVEPNKSEILENRKSWAEDRS